MIVEYEGYNTEFVRLCIEQKYKGIAPLQEGTRVLTYYLWESDHGNLCGVEYFLGDTTSEMHQRRMYFNVEDALKVLTFIQGTATLRKLSRKKFMNELVQRATNERLLTAK